MYSYEIINPKYFNTNRILIHKQVSTLLTYGTHVFSHSLIHWNSSKEQLTDKILTGILEEIILKQNF